MSLEGDPRESKYRDVTGEQGRLAEVGHKETKDSLHSTDRKTHPLSSSRTSSEESP